MKRWFKFAIASIALMFIASTPACASPSSDSVPPDILNATGDWAECRTTKLLTLVQTPRTPESIVDESLAACAKFEVEMTKLWKKHYGPNSGSQVLALRARWREGLIAQVHNLRDGTPITDPYKTWGLCIGGRIPKPLPPDASSESIADSAMESCLPELERLRAEITQRYGSAKASADIELLRQELRKKAIAMIEKERSTQ